MSIPSYRLAWHTERLSELDWVVPKSSSRSLFEDEYTPTRPPHSTQNVPAGTTYDHDVAPPGLLPRRPSVPSLLRRLAPHLRAQARFSTGTPRSGLASPSPLLSAPPPAAPQHSRSNRASGHVRVPRREGRERRARCAIARRCTGHR